MHRRHGVGLSVLPQLPSYVSGDKVSKSDIYIDMVVEAQAPAELRLVSVFGRITPLLVSVINTVSRVKLALMCGRT